MNEGNVRKKMNESRWAICSEPDEMLRFLGPTADARKLRLFACACCRRVLGLLKDSRPHDAILIAEKFADGQATQDELKAARDAAAEFENWARICEWAAEADADFECNAEYSSASAAAYAACAVMLACGEVPAPFEMQQKSSHSEAASAVWFSARAAALSSQEDRAINLKLWRRLDKISDRAEREGRACQAHLIRDIFGNPFRGECGTSQLRVCKGSSILELAQCIYADRDFDKLPVLASLLAEGGCREQEILSHSRNPAVHVRGCWALDAILRESCE